MVVHPGQIDLCNKAFTPTQAAFERALEIVAAYRHATAEEHRGAIMLGGEMVDEASLKMAEQLVARGVAGGLDAPPA
jgi:citrate lyase subunit beta/citryl-CoA lyase